MSPHPLKRCRSASPHCEDRRVQPARNNSGPRGLGLPGLANHEQSYPRLGASSTPPVQGAASLSPGVSDQGSRLSHTPPLTLPDRVPWSTEFTEALPLPTRSGYFLHYDENFGERVCQQYELVKTRGCTWNNTRQLMSPSEIDELKRITVDDAMSDSDWDDMEEEDRTYIRQRFEEAAKVHSHSRLVTWLAEQKRQGCIGRLTLPPTAVRRRRQDATDSDSVARVSSGASEPGVTRRTEATHSGNWDVPSDAPQVSPTIRDPGSSGTHRVRLGVGLPEDCYGR